MSAHVPTRVVRHEQAQREFGVVADRLTAGLLEGDPLADEAISAMAQAPSGLKHQWMSTLDPAELRDPPPAVRALWEAVHATPHWYDEARCSRGGAAFLGTGAWGALVLAYGSLAGSYLSPGGNKPLVMTGSLERDTFRRLLDSGRFTFTVSQAGALRPGGRGRMGILHVRLMHARVRRQLQSSAKWSTPDWGLPINQADMAVTPLLFSSVAADCLKTLGVRLRDEEVSDLVHLWRCVGHWMGVRDELLCATVEQARELFAATEMMQDTPDDDSRRLLQALLNTDYLSGLLPTSVQRPVAELLCRTIMGPERARALHLGDGLVPLAWRKGALMGRGISAMWRTLPGADAFRLRTGQAFWKALIADRKSAKAEQPARHSHGMPSSVQAQAA